MNITILGCGFIGHHLANKLAQDKSNNIKCIIRRNLPKTYEFIRDNTNISIIQKNINDSQFYINNNQDVIVYLASESNARTFRDLYTINPELTKSMMYTPTEILGGLNYNSSTKFIYFSSSMVYGEFNDTTPSETSPTNPIEPYGINKLASEQIIRYYCKRMNIPYTIVRPSAVYGPNDEKYRVIEKFMSRALSGYRLNIYGDQILDFTYIEDLINGIELIIKKPKESYNQTFNMTSGNPTWLLDAAHEIVKNAGAGSINIEEKDDLYPTRGGLDISKAKKILGYNPIYDIKSGIKRCFELRQ